MITACGSDGDDASQATVTQPASVAVDPLGKFAYVANETDGSISVYTIDTTTGALR